MFAKLSTMIFARSGGIGARLGGSAAVVVAGTGLGAVGAGIYGLACALLSVAIHQNLNLVPHQVTQFLLAGSVAGTIAGVCLAIDRAGDWVKVPASSHALAKGRFRRPSPLFYPKTLPSLRR